MWTWCKTDILLNFRVTIFWREYLLENISKVRDPGMLQRLEPGCLNFVPKFPMLPINLNIANDSNVDFFTTKEKKIGISIFSLSSISILWFWIFCFSYVLECYFAYYPGFLFSLKWHLFLQTSFLPSVLGLRAWICLSHNKHSIITLTFLFAILSTKCFSALMLRFLFQHLLSLPLLFQWFLVVLLD